MTSRSKKRALPLRTSSLLVALLRKLAHKRAARGGCAKHGTRVALAATRTASIGHFGLQHPAETLAQPKPHRRAVVNAHVCAVTVDCRRKYRDRTFPAVWN